jgi:hypothetical protein
MSSPLFNRTQFRGYSVFSCHTQQFDREWLRIPPYSSFTAILLTSITTSSICAARTMFSASTKMRSTSPSVIATVFRRSSNVILTSLDKNFPCPPKQSSELCRGETDDRAVRLPSLCCPRQTARARLRRYGPALEFIYRTFRPR